MIIFLEPNPDSPLQHHPVPSQYISFHVMSVFSGHKQATTPECEPFTNTAVPLAIQR
jgi:hypothetical protein